MKSSFDLLAATHNINEFIQKFPLPVAVINPEKEILAYNRAFFLMAGREIRQGTHYCHEFLNFPFCQTECLADMAKTLKRTVNWDESHGHRKNGDELIVRPTVTPLTNEDGELQGYVLLFQDTTDEVQLYRNFRSNLDHLERKVAFLSTLNDAAEQFRKVQQVETLLLKITDFVVEHLGIQCCQVIQEQQEQFTPICTSSGGELNLNKEEQQELVNSVIEEIAILEKEHHPHYLHNFKENSEGLHKQDISVLFPITSGTHDYGYLAIHQFHGEEELNQERIDYLSLFAKSIGPYIENCHIIANLESIVTERTQELRATQAQLMESTRLASVGETAGMVAHEVLNPMTAVLARIRKLQAEEGAVDLIKIIVEAWEEDYQEAGAEEFFENLKEVPEDSDVPLIEEDMENIKDSVADLEKDLPFIEEQLNRIVGIVDNLRGLSRAQDSKQLTDVADPIRKTENLSHDGLAKRHIELDIDLQHTSKVSCDPNELIQVLHNLVRNGMQAIEKKGKISIKTRETPDRVEIRVIDSGPGVPEEVAPKVFEMRFTTKTSKEGTGLGLGLSRRLMRQALGDVELEYPKGKEEGQGAVFLCWLPKNTKKSD